ncbi:type II secretion system protein GspD [Sphingobium sp. EM0848]|uniref:type II secretion system protein GspD n=1 Tax=Sphingobium sp. EM0848 TaxID=2743473 RepID=UPI00159C2240|nr:secretin N-terminal domain-containing protein [Sphingobium sp. EM0848]
MAHHRILLVSTALLSLWSTTSDATGTPPPIPSWFQAQTGGDNQASGTIEPVSQGLIAGAGEIFEVVPLKYADVSEVVGLLTGNQTIRPNDGFSPQEPNFGSAGLQGYYGSGGNLPGSPLVPVSGGFNQSNDSLGRAVDSTIGVDRRLNAVILRGLPSRLAAIKDAIAKLDVPVASVVLETEFVELTETGAHNLGLDFNNTNNQIVSGYYTFSKGFPGFSDTPRGGGVTANFQVALYVQIAKGEGRIVSKPRISAQSGGTAKIVTGDALPILTSIALSGVNAVQQQVQYVNVGVTLQIAPRVSEDGYVTSHLFAVVSSVTGYSQGYPTISQREASTSATVRDGQTFVIGGLTQESNIANHSKLPLFGDVPLLGKLFNTEHTSRTKRDLFIVVTPHILRNRDEAGKVTCAEECR